MSANQYTGKAAVAAKAQTNAKLAQAVQSPIPASARVRNELNAELQQRLNRKAEVEGVLMAFKSELEDEVRVIEALNRALDALAEEAPLPNLHLVMNEDQS